MAQIRDTLKNLLRSLEDEGHDAEAIERQRVKGCDSMLRKAAQEEDQARTGLAHLEADLKEHEAAVEEAEGTVQQLRADAALVAHTLNQTREVMEARRRNNMGPEAQQAEDARLLKALLQNKQQTLTSLQGELEVILPALSQLQANVAETKRRLADRQGSANTGRILALALKDSCTKGAARALKREDADTQALNSIETALQELDAIAADARKQQAEATEAVAPPHDAAPSGPSAAAAPPAGNVPVADTGAGAQDAAATDDDIDPTLAFVQISQDRVTTEDDLISIFGGAGAALSPSPAAPQRKSVMAHHRGRGRSHRSAPHTEGSRQMALLSMAPPKSAAAQPHIRKMLAALRLKGNGEADQKEWCEQEAAQNQHVLKLVQASIQEMSAEIDAHTDTEAQITDDLNRIKETNATLLLSAKEVTEEQSTREQEFIKNGAKDQALASKILSQAISILSEMERTGKVVENLKSAKAAFEAQMEAATSARKELVDTTREVKRSSSESVTALEGERVNLEIARFSHVSQQARCEESQHMFEAEAKEVTAYLKSLSEECQAATPVLEDEERRVQVRALEDAESVLAGKKVQKDVDKAIKSVKEKRNLSPMERAAAEMGVAVEDS
jgi:chromosome segregation ATPase